MSVESAMQTIEASLGRRIGNGQCYALTAWYEQLVSPNNSIQLGAGVTTAITGLIKGGINAADIGEDYVWKTQGWSVFKPTRINQLSRGMIINWYKNGIHTNGQYPVNATYGHTGVIQKVVGNTIYTIEQNHGSETLRVFTGSNISGISSIIAPPGISDEQVTEGLLNKGDMFMDVSAYQSGDLNAYSGRLGFNKSIIKVSEGTSYLNPRLGQQLGTSQAVGFYHYAHFGGDEAQARREANFFIANMPNGQVGKMAVLDYEEKATANRAANTVAIITFLEVVRNAGYIPVIYCSTSYANNFDAAGLKAAGVYFWIAHYITMGNINSIPWDFQKNIHPLADMWQFAQAYQGFSLDVNVTINPIGGKTIVERNYENMDFVLRSKSGKQGYVGITNGNVYGIGAIDTVTQLQEKAKHVELSLDDDDFNRFIAAHQK